MKDVSYYKDREQTYLKHFFLEQYLERVARVIGFSYPGFVYVDGFSGPWQSDHERFEDTSFMIAIQQLRRVRDDLVKVGKSPSIRCLFIEKNPVAFASLRTAVDAVTDLDVEVLNGDFETSIPDILKFIGSDFSLVFIDPTGWTGFALQKIAPILKHKPGEVLINFMFDYINRFLGKGIADDSFDELFGGPGWHEAVQTVSRREESIVELYEERLRQAGAFRHITRTRILKPTVDRAYFYLIYGTGHIKGLQEFRGIEKKCVGEQERVRLSAKQDSRRSRTGQGELWPATELSAGLASFKEEQRVQLDRARAIIREVTRSNSRIRFSDLLGRVLELPLVWEGEIQTLLKQMMDEGAITAEGMTSKERTIKPHHFLVVRRS